MYFSLLDRQPKKLVERTIKFDQDEIDAIDELRHLSNPPKPFGTYVREQVQLKMTQTFGYRLGFHNIRILQKKFEEKLGNTFTCEVTPHS